MLLNVGINQLSNYTFGKNSNNTNHEAYNQYNKTKDRLDIVEINKNEKPWYFEKKKIALTSIISAGVLICTDFTLNHGRITKNFLQKLNPTKQVAKSYVKNVEQIQDAFSQIFGKNISKDEASMIAKKYKDIISKDNIDTLADELFIELKKDYGLHGIELCKESKISLGANTQGGAMINPTATKITLYMDAILEQKNPKQTLFDVLCHELCHARQTRILYRANKEKLIDIIANNAPKELTKECWNEILRENGNDKDKAINVIKNILRNSFEQEFGNVENLPAKNAIEIEALFDNKQNHKYAGTVTLEEYKQQPIEKEAYNIGDLAKNILKLLEVE